MLDPNSVGIVSSTSQQLDPDMKSIMDLESQSRYYSNEISKNTSELTTLEININNIKREMQSSQGNPIKQKKLQEMALPMLRRQKILAETNTAYSQKQANFDVLALKLKNARRDKMESELFKEANIRMQMNQEQLNPDELKNTFKETRTLNKKSEKASAIMSSSITLDDFDANDDSLLLELSNFDSIDLYDSNQLSNYGSTSISNPLQQQQQQQHYTPYQYQNYQQPMQQPVQQQQQQQRRLINNNNNNSM